MSNIFSNSEKKLYFRQGKITYLRPLLKNDICIEYLSWLNNPELNKYSSHFRTWPTTEKDIDEFYDDTKSNNHIVFATCCKKTGEHFGNCSIDNIDWINRNAHFNINIGLKKYRTIHFLDILNVIAEYSFNTLNLNKLCGGAEIPGILELHKRMGWKLEGVLRKHFFREGKYVDLTLFSILKEDFIKQN